MKEFNNVKKVCGFYISNMHLATMILPYTNKQLEKGIKFATLLEYNLKQNIEVILSRLTLNEESKKEIMKINWENNLCKYTDIEKFLRAEIKSHKEITILISGSENYINIANQNLNMFIIKNNKKIESKYIKIINCYEVGEFNNNIKEILDSHDSIINTSGEHKIEEIFEGYSKNA